MSDLFTIFNFAVWGILFLVLLFKFYRSICLVSTRKAYIVERLGKYTRTLGPGFHVLIPFVDKVAFVRDLKEHTIDVPPQSCFTKDEVRVEVDGVAYISVVDPVKASYGVTNYQFAATQLAQTTTRSIIGTIELDRTFEERDLISSKVVKDLAEAGESWGIQVHRYEVKNLTPPPTVKEAMEKQVNAERERRALQAKSEGDRQSRINLSEGRKIEMINKFGRRDAEAGQRSRRQSGRGSGHRACRLRLDPEGGRRRRPARRRRCDPPAAGGTFPGQAGEPGQERDPSDPAHRPDQPGQDPGFARPGSARGVSGKRGFSRI